jgi:hypothetical protein
MRTPDEIYAAYRIMPSLALHQLRVAAVAKTIAESHDRAIDVHRVVLCGLFHDMANIIKADLTYFPEFVEPEGFAHWQLIKEDFIARYGTSEHKAALEIARELGLPDEVRKEIGNVGFAKLDEVRDSESLERKVCEYSDLRVGPHGVLTMDARLREAHERYRVYHSPEIPQEEDRFEELVGAAREVERQIFEDALIAPDDITEASIQDAIADIRSEPISY